MFISLVSIEIFDISSPLPFNFSSELFYFLLTIAQFQQLKTERKLRKHYFLVRAKILNCKIAINSPLCRAGSRSRILIVQSDPDFEKVRI